MAGKPGHGGPKIRRNGWQIQGFREKIKVHALLKRLQDHAHDRCNMSPTQLKAAEILLRKALPDLHAVDLSVTDQREVRDMTTAELMQLAAQQAGDAAAEQQRDAEDTGVRH